MWSSFLKEILENIQKERFWFWHFLKRSNFDSFFRHSSPKTEIVFNKFLQKWTPHTLFTLFWYPTPHMRTSIKAKKLFCTECPKSVVKIFIFEYFQKIPSEMNSTHPFYPILIPNTSCVKDFILLKSLFLTIFKIFLQKWTPHTLFTLFWYPTSHV